MLNVILTWYRRYFSDPEAVMLLISLLVIFWVVTSMAGILAPVFVSLVIAYLLQAVMNTLERLRIPHTPAVIIVYILFIGVLVFVCLWLLPLLWRQMTNLVNEFPYMVARAQALLMRLPEQYPNYISSEQSQAVLEQAKVQLANLGRLVFSLSLASIPGIIQIVIYLVLVPLLVFFFIKDRTPLVAWCRQYLPHEKRLILEVWTEVNLQLGNYVRGKVIELCIVWVVTYVAFAILGLQYASLLAALVGFSVIVPYIGAVVATIPVIIVALMQWGGATPFWYLVTLYTLIITLDGNLLVPILFSEVMNIHPVAIILAVLFFGGIWGFWGIFFAIPLATVVKAVLTAWPTQRLSNVS